MLRVGLTGGIGAGKSTVSATFAACGAVIVDGDVISREVVAVGTEGLAALADEFGSHILLPDGALDRPALAAIAFSDEGRRRALNGIVHPLVAHRRSELIAAAADDAVIIEDIPLLVESGMAPLFPLVVIVHAEVDVRLKRLIEVRGMTEADAKARIAAQATEEQRRQAADIWLDNAGTEGELVERVRQLWHQRIEPFSHNLASRTRVQASPRLVAADPSWPDQAGRILARLNTACGHRALRIDHIGSTAVRGLDAKDVIDIQVTVASLDVADALADDLLRAGYPRAEEITADEAKADARSTDVAFDHATDSRLWHKRFHASADPGRPANIHLRVAGWPNQQFALLFCDWLSANPGVQADYLAAKRIAAAHQDIDLYVAAKEPWFLDAYRRAWNWADATGWSPG